MLQKSHHCLHTKGLNPKVLFLQGVQEEVNWSLAVQEEASRNWMLQGQVKGEQYNTSPHLQIDTKGWLPKVSLLRNLMVQEEAEHLSKAQTEEGSLL